MFKLKNISFLCLLLGSLIVGAQCPTGTNTFTVTNNSGNNILGSIRRACQCVNSTPAITTIEFAIPSGSTVIQPNAELLITANGILVDGATQNGIVIDGSSVAGAPPHGMRLTGTGITVQGLEIQNFTATAGGHGIRTDANGNTITGNTLHDNRNGVFTNTGVATALISENSIFCNSLEGISRATGPALPTLVANTQRVRGTATANAMVEVFINDPTGCAAAPCQGKILVGATTASASGIWQIILQQGDLTAGQQVTATATLNGNNTSEFTTCVTVADCSAFNVNVVDTDVSCFGNTNGTASATATGGSPIAAVTFLWSTGATTANISNLAPNNYTVTATDAAGCTATEGAIVAEPALLSNSFTAQNISCFGGANGTLTAVPAGGTPTYSYVWNTGQMVAGINNLVAGIYTVTVTDNNGCSIVRNTQLTQPALLTNSFTTQNVSCFGGANGALTAVPAGGTPTYSFVWNTGQMVAAITNVVAGVYTVTVTDNNGCTIVSNTQLTQPPVITLIASATAESTAGAMDGTATAIAGGGTPGLNYLWSNGGTTAQITGLPPGTYSVTVIDAKGCRILGMTTVGSTGTGACTALPVYALYTPDEVCGNTPFTLEADDLFPNAAVKYIWLLPSGDSATTTDPTSTCWRLPRLFPATIMYAAIRLVAPPFS